MAKETYELEMAQKIGRMEQSIEQLNEWRTTSIELQRETLREISGGFSKVDERLVSMDGRLDELEKSDAARTEREKAGSGGFWSMIAGFYRDASPAKKAAIWTLITTAGTGLGAAAREALLLLLGA